MENPDQRLFEEDLRSAAFRMGIAKERWGVPAADAVPSDLVWPKRVLWISAAPRPNAPTRFHLLLDLKGYRSASPTGAFYDLETKTYLATARWPKGKSDSRFAKVFRTDWGGGVAFYHPFDRVAAAGHTSWPQEQPHLLWAAERTIVDYLGEFQSLLQGRDYLGV